MDSAPSSLNLPCVCTTLRKAAHAVSRVYDAALAAAGMTGPQLAILSSIRERDGLTLGELTGEMIMDRASLYRALTPMMSAGWVRVSDAQAGRAMQVFLTDDGREAAALAANHWANAQIRFVEALGAERWRALSHALMGVIEAGADLAP